MLMVLFQGGLRLTGQWVWLVSIVVFTVLRGGRWGLWADCDTKLFLYI